LHRHDTHRVTAARALGTAIAVSAALCFFSVAHPYSPEAPTRLNVVVGMLASIIAASLLLGARRVGSGYLHLCLAIGTTVTGVSVASSQTASGAVVTAYGMVWVATYSAWFHERRATLSHLALIGATLAVALTQVRMPAPLSVWVFVMATTCGIGIALNTLAGRLRLAADHDPLTGLLRRQAFAARAHEVMRRSRERREPVSLAILDLDDFKAVNDTHGHEAGDDLLRNLATAWTETIRVGDLLGRHGGDEFVLLMPDTTRTEAQSLLQRLAAASRAGSWSAGVAEWDGEPLVDWRRRADEELYSVKRGRTVSAPASRSPTDG
jgi:diguanylate cyclase (GGDEF)-like protein